MSPFDLLPHFGETVDAMKVGHRGDSRIRIFFLDKLSNSLSFPNKPEISIIGLIAPERENIAIIRTTERTTEVDILTCKEGRLLATTQTLTA